MAYDEKLNTIDMEHVVEELIELVSFISSAYIDSVSEKHEQDASADIALIGDEICGLLAGAGSDEIPIVAWPE